MLGGGVDDDLAAVPCQPPPSVLGRHVSPPWSPPKLTLLAIAVKHFFSYTHRSGEREALEGAQGDRPPPGPPGAAAAGDHRGDPRHRRRGHDRRRGQRAQPRRGGAAPRRPAAVALQVLPLPDGDLRRALPAGPARAPRRHARGDGARRAGAGGTAAGLEASGRWALDHRAVAELLFWRPVPSFEPSPEAFAPSVEMVDLQRAALADAVAAGQLGPGAERRGRPPRVDADRRLCSARPSRTSPTCRGARAGSRRSSRSSCACCRLRSRSRAAPPARTTPEPWRSTRERRRKLRAGPSHGPFLVLLVITIIVWLAAELRQAVRSPSSPVRCSPSADGRCLRRTSTPVRWPPGSACRSSAAASCSASGASGRWAAYFTLTVGATGHCRGSLPAPPPSELHRDPVCHRGMSASHRLSVVALVVCVAAGLVHRIRVEERALLLRPGRPLPRGRRTPQAPHPVRVVTPAIAPACPTAYAPCRAPAAESGTVVPTRGGARATTQDRWTGPPSWRPR